MEVRTDAVGSGFSRTIAVAVTAAALLQAQTPSPAAIDALFAPFLDARTQFDTTVAATAIWESGISFDEALARLKRGRTYASDVPRGVVQGKYSSDSVPALPAAPAQPALQFFYTLDVPQNYNPARKYPVRIQLHGGVGRLESSGPPRQAANARLAGAEQIYVLPYAWRDAPWWSGLQTANLRTILDRVKRSYNVDENRVVLSGVSDGGTGAIYTAMRDTTPYAAFLPMNGFIGVLRNETVDADGDLFPHNLVNKPLLVVNGGRDPQYPTSLTDPYIAHLKNGGVDIDYRPQPNAAHDTSWWPELKDTFEAFVTSRPRAPLPDTLTWESGTPNLPSRVHWIVIDRLAARGSEPELPDVNRMTTKPALDFGIRGSGNRINRVVRGSNAEQLGLKSGDVVSAINGQPSAAGTDVAEALRNFPAGRPVILTVARGGESLRITGRYAPSVLPGEAESMFPRQNESGRVDALRTDNTVDLKTRGVGALRVLVSPDQFDLSQPVKVVVNGRTAFEGAVQKNVRTLLEWAARDNDRTMLFAAELPIEIR
jgi:hypothetical protein